MADLSDEDGTKTLTAALIGRKVVRIEVRRDGRELFIEFDDQSRLFANADDLDLSLTSA